MSVFYRNGKTYGISDYSANNVTYDNSESGLEAVNTQDAIDKVKEKITDTFGTAQFRVQDGEIQWKAEGADTWNPFRANTLVGMDLEMVAHSQNTTTEATLTYTAEEEGFYLFVGAACNTGTGRTPSITPDTTATEVFSWCYAIQDGELLATTSKCNDLWFIILYKFNVGDAITITHKSSYNGSGDMLIFKVTLPSNYPSSVEIIDEARNIGIGDYEFIMTNTGTGTITYEVDVEGLYFASEGYDPGSDTFAIDYTNNTAKFLGYYYTYISGSNTGHQAVWYAKPGDVISFTFGTSGYGQALSRVTLTDIELNLLAVNNGMAIVDYQELRYPATTSHVNAATVTATVPAEFAGRKGFVICSTGSGKENDSTIEIVNNCIDIETTIIEDMNTDDMTSDPIAVYYGTLKEGTITVTGDSSNWKRSARCLIMVNNISERWGIIPESVIMYKLAKVIPSTKFLTMTFLTSKNFTQPNDPVFTFSDNITDFNTISINSTRIASSSYDSQAANTSLCFNICNSINIGEEYTITPSTYGEVFNYTIPLSADSDFITGSYTIPSERFLLIMAAYSSSTWDSTITATVELSSNITVENLHTTYQFVDSSSYSSYYAQTAIYIAECTSSNIGEEFTASISYGNDIKNPISPILVKL